MLTETDLAAIRVRLGDRLRRRIPGAVPAAAGSGGGQEPAPRSVLVCGAGGCSGGGRQLYAAMRDELLRRGLSEQVELVSAGCLGLCGAGPVLLVAPEGAVYTGVRVSDVWEIVEDHLLAGKPVERLLAGYAGPEGKLFSGETRLIISRWGTVNPERLEEAVAAGAYQALAEAVLRRTPASLGEPAARLIAGSAQADCLVCSLNESAPGASIRRTLAESDPHSLLEGMALAAYAVGAEQAVLHVPAEYALAAERLRLALRSAEDAGFLGRRILGSEFSLRVEIRTGVEEFLQKDAPALLEALHGRRAAPEAAIEGLSGGPFSVDGERVLAANPESLVRLAFAAASLYGVPGACPSGADTQLLSLGGRIQRPRLCEAASAVSLRELIDGIGGGVPAGESVQAVQYGGPAGGFLRPDQLDAPLCSARLRAWSEGMGAPVLTVIGGRENLLDSLRVAYRYLGSRSCGRCSTCRIGLARMEERLSEYSEEEPDDAILHQLLELGRQLMETSRCAFGRSSAIPILTYLAHFRGISREKND